MAHHSTKVVTYQTEGPRCPSPRISLCLDCEERYHREGSLALTTVSYGLHRGECYYDPEAIERRAEEAREYAEGQRETAQARRDEAVAAQYADEYEAE